MTARQALRLGGDRAGALAARVTGALRDLTLRPLSPYSAAAMRIGLAGLYVLHLLRELPHASRLWGPDSPFTPALFAETLAARGQDGAFAWWYQLLSTDSSLVFYGWYAVALLVSALYALGWHTRAMAPLFVFVVVAFYLRGTMANSGWALLSLLFANYLVLVASGRHWSLDARRRAKRGDIPSRYVVWGEETEELRRRAVTVLHNAGLGVIALQVMVIYTSAAMYKIRGASWRDGTALYYSMMSDDFSTFPELSAWIASHGTFAAVMAYVTVFSQVLFAALVFNRRLKYVILVVMLSTHIGIGVFMALPLFSAITVVGDLVFLPTSFWLAAAGLVRVWRQPGENSAPPSSETEAQAGAVPGQRVQV
ncbi:HTTM domain-containing protein [Streptomyces sp. NPDC051561]|uniref:HTTM domain-containing protein n=1 Tax=Streptomyces sp. NPDC051561 TaxID=3365658 RepID=UPI0037B7653F